MYVCNWVTSLYSRDGHIINQPYFSFLKVIKTNATLIRMIITIFLKKYENNKCWQRCGETETLAYISGNVNGETATEKNGGSSKESKLELPHDRAAPHGEPYIQKNWRQGPEETAPLCSQQVSTTVKKQEAPCSSMAGRRSAVWLQRRITQPLKGRKPCDLGHEHRACVCAVCFHSCEAPKVAKLIGTESRTVTTRKRGRGERGYRASDLQDKPRDLFHKMFIHLTPLTRTLKNS